MPETELSLTQMVSRNQQNQLETAWLEAMDEGATYREEMLEALTSLVKAGQSQQADTLAGMWLSNEKEQQDPEAVLELAKELLLRCNNNEELRQEVLRLYQEVYADRPELQELVEHSGLEGGKSPLRALRTLDICLNLKVGDILLSRSEERAGEVTEIDTDTCLYTIRTRTGEQILNPDELALAYDPVEPSDFRALTQLYPERIKELLNTDPTSVVIGILRSAHGQIDSDELAHMLSPRYVPADQWRKWWSKAKSALKRCPNVVVEGRTRNILTYHEKEQTLEDEIQPQWEACQTTQQRLAVLDTYFREAKHRKTEPSAALIKSMHKELTKRIKTARKGAPHEALAEALLIDRIKEDADLPDDATHVVDEILKDQTDYARLLSSLQDRHLYVRALERVRGVLGDNWPEIYEQLLPIAPREACDFIAKSLHEAGETERLQAAVNRIPEDFSKHIEALHWLWKGPSVEVEMPMPERELLLRMLDHLAALSLKDTASADLLRDVRLNIRGALSAGKYARFRKVIEAMDAGLASTVHRTIDRLDGLGQVVHSDLLRIIVDTHPSIIKPRERIDPWFDESTIFCTEQGLQKCQDEIDHLQNVKIPENAKAIGEAAARGDLSENSEYKFALEERDLLQARLMQMQQAIAAARVLNAEDISTNRVGIGTRVELQSTEDEEKAQFTILGPWESDVDQGIYNYKAPICRNLKDLTIGDTVSLSLGDTSGEKKYRVERIANALRQ